MAGDRTRKSVRVRAKRIQLITEALRSRPRRIPELAAEFGVHPRTIRRDLDLIADTESGLENRAGVYRLPNRPGLALEMPEALAIYAATRLLVDHARIVDRHYVSALRKLVQQVPEPARSRLAEVEDLLPSRGEGSNRTLELVALAWFERKLLRFDYRRNPFKESTSRHHVEVYHYELSPVNLAGYVIGLSRERGGVRIFKVDRIENAMLMADSFEIPATFDPLPHLSSAWGILSADPFDAKLWCHASIAMQIQEFDHRGIVIDEVLPDGGLLFTIRAARTDRGEANELRSWIESWGPQMKVLEPEWLRARVVADLADAMALYAEEE